MLNSKQLFERRKRRNRYNLRRRSHGQKPRLSVHRSNLHIYAQIIDDLNGKTLASASSNEKELREKLASGANRDAAGEVGKLIAVRAKEAGIGEVIFDRGGYAFHGRVKALADAAREAGLTF